VMRVNESGTFDDSIWITDGTADNTRQIVDLNAQDFELGSAYARQTMLAVGPDQVLLAESVLRDAVAGRDIQTLMLLDVGEETIRVAGSTDESPYLAGSVPMNGGLFIDAGEPARFDPTDGSITYLADIQDEPRTAAPYNVYKATSGEYALTGNSNFASASFFIEGELQREWRLDAPVLSGSGRHRVYSDQALAVGDRLIVPRENRIDDVTVFEYVLLDPDNGTLSVLSTAPYRGGLVVGAVQAGDSVLLRGTDSEGNSALVRLDADNLLAPPTPVVGHHVERAFTFGEQVLMFLVPTDPTQTRYWATVDAAGNVGPALVSGGSGGTGQTHTGSRAEGIEFDGGFAFVSAVGHEHTQVFFTDGTTDGTRRLSNLDGGEPTHLQAAGSQLFFSAPVDFDQQLHVATSAAESAVPVDEPIGTPVAAVNGRVVGVYRGEDAAEIVATDGQAVATLVEGSLRYDSIFTFNVDGTEYASFTIDGPATQEYEIWVTDGFTARKITTTENYPRFAGSLGETSAVWVYDERLGWIAGTLADPTNQLTLETPPVVDLQQQIQVTFAYDHLLAPATSESDLWIVRSADGATTVDPDRVHVRLGQQQIQITVDGNLPSGSWEVHLPRDAAWNINGATIVEDLTVPFSVLNGDVDGDGDVDLVDAAMLERNFGRQDDPPVAQGDLDYDGDVDLFDAALLERAFGSSQPAVLRYVPAGEPSLRGTTSLFSDERISSRWSRLRDDTPEFSNRRR
ncbi:MAG: dockerin type I domain-containing protein, partial [Planctomycetota bacterium]